MVFSSTVRGQSFSMHCIRFASPSLPRYAMSISEFAVIVERDGRDLLLDVGYVAISTKAMVAR